MSSLTRLLLSRRRVVVFRISSGVARDNLSRLWLERSRVSGSVPGLWITVGSSPDILQTCRNKAKSIQTRPVHVYSNTQ